jgi:hypothetical protein
MPQFTQVVFNTQEGDYPVLEVLLIIITARSQDPTLTEVQWCIVDTNGCSHQTEFE